jgi:hypothetical protein
MTAIASIVLHRALPDLQRMKRCYSVAASSAPRSGDEMSVAGATGRRDLRLVDTIETTRGEQDDWFPFRRHSREFLALDPAWRGEDILRIAMTASDIPTTNGMPNNGFEVLWDLTRADRLAGLRPGLARFQLRCRRAACSFFDLHSVRNLSQAAAPASSLDDRPCTRAPGDHPMVSWGF